MEPFQITMIWTRLNYLAMQTTLGSYYNEKGDSASFSEWSDKEWNATWGTTEIYKWCGVFDFLEEPFFILKESTHQNCWFLLAPSWVQGLSFWRLNGTLYPPTQVLLNKSKLYAASNELSVFSFAPKYLHSVLNLTVREYCRPWRGLVPNFG